MADHAKSLDKVEVNNNHCSPLGHTAAHSIIEVNQVDQMKFTLGKSVLGLLSHILLLHVPSFEKDLLHNPPRDRWWADESIVPKIFLHVLFEDGCVVCFFPYSEIRPCQ